MKNRFNTIDTIAIVIELQKIKESRVNQVYDVDNKTYLIKLNAPDSSKITLLFESGIRIHTTKCDWPKNSTPSGFTMKLRKHIRNKRIVKIEQLGCDRIIDLQFGTGEAAYHLLLEFFNRGNIVLTDHEYTIVSLLRMYSDGENHHFAPHEKYPIDRARERKNLTLHDLEDSLKKSKKNDQLRKCLLPSIDFGLSFLEHCLRKVGLSPDLKISSPSIIEDLQDKLVKLVDELATADDLLAELQTKGSKGYISGVKRTNDQGHELFQMVEFNPYAFVQNTDYDTISYDSFTDAVDEYFSKLESQKLELSVIEKETEAMKKVHKIRADQESRLQELSQKQILDKVKADRIMNNASTVEDAIKIVRFSIAAQMSWGSIKDLIEEAKRRNDPIASLISNTKFEVNQISMMLSDPFADLDEENTPVEVDIDLSLSAHANATRYYDHKKHAAIKEKKTLESQKKALKSAEKKARAILKTVHAQVAITVSRKVYWFEKFFWFISSDNYLVIGGRDQKQNELIVKKYMKLGDLYVHADLIGASSVIIKNPSGAPVPPRTLDEAGHMAVCYSNAWDTKIICRAWWVYDSQVSKSAPSGEYLVTGSFMIRGQKNYLLPTHLQLGFSFLFKIEESSIFRHIDERKPKLLEDSASPSGINRAPALNKNSEIKSDLEGNTDEFEELQIDDDNPENDDEDLQIDNDKPENDEGFDNISSQDPSLENNGEKHHSTSYIIRDNSRSHFFKLKYPDQLCYEQQEEMKEKINTDNALVISIKDGSDSQQYHSNCNKAVESDTKIDTENALIISVNPNSCQYHSKAEESLVVKHFDSSDGGVSLENLKISDIIKKGKAADVIISNDPESSTSIGNLKNDSLGMNNTIHLKDEQKDDTVKQQGKLKRGQKSKLKKIKEKYKDQDEEEKQLRMSILQSAGSSKKNEKKLSKSGGSSDKQKKKSEQPQSKKSNIQAMKDLDPAILEIEGETEPVAEREISTELDMLSSFTGQPHPDDELLYALPVVAPYNSVLNNKFKMKIVPGTSKRGKAARLALEYFIRSKDCTSTEKELLKCVPDQALSRNFPGKIKLLSVQPKKKY